MRRREEKERERLVKMQGIESKRSQAKDGKVIEELRKTIKKKEKVGPWETKNPLKMFIYENHPKKKRKKGWQNLLYLATLSFFFSLHNFQSKITQRKRWVFFADYFTWVKL